LSALGLFPIPYYIGKVIDTTLILLQFKAGMAKEQNDFERKPGKSLLEPIVPLWYAYLSIRGILPT